MAHLLAPRQKRHESRHVREEYDCFRVYEALWRRPSRMPGRKPISQPRCPQASGLSAGLPRLTMHRIVRQPRSDTSDQYIKQDIGPPWPQHGKPRAIVHSKTRLGSCGALQLAILKREIST